MPPISQQPLAPFASLPVSALAKGRRASLLQMFFAPFSDVDDRVARKMAAQQAEREARRAATSVAGAPRSR